MTPRGLFYPSLVHRLCPSLIALIECIFFFKDTGHVCPLNFLSMYNQSMPLRSTVFFNRFNARVKSPPLGSLIENFTCPVLWEIVGVSSHIIGDRVLYNWTCKPSELYGTIKIFYSQRFNKTAWMPRLQFYHGWDSWNMPTITTKPLLWNSLIHSNLCQAKAEIYSCQLYQNPYVWACSKYQLWFQQGSCRC